MNKSGIIKRINKKIWYIRRLYNKKKFQNVKLSIISCNCTGGLVLSEYGIKFDTPTINLFFSAYDFVKFCERMDYYLNQEIIEPNIDYVSSLNRNYPLAFLDDILIHAVHYKNFTEFKHKWNERKLRIDKERLFLIFTDRDGFDPSLLPRIEVLPFRKVLFSKNDYPGYDFVCKIPSSDNLKTCRDLSEFIGVSGKRYYSFFDFPCLFKNYILTN